MKKSILLLSGLGIGAGVLYAIGSRGGSSLKQTSTGNGNNKQPTDDVTENGKENRPSLTLASTREAGDDVAKKSSMAAADNGTRASADEDVLERRSVAALEADLVVVDHRVRPRPHASILDKARSRGYGREPPCRDA